MAWLLAVLLPPVYLFSRGRVGAGLLNGFFFLLSFPLLFIFGIGVLTWLFCVFHACYYLKGEWEEQQADRIANRAAARVQELQQADPTKNY